MTEYNRTQTDYRERCKARIQRQLEISKIFHTFFCDDFCYSKRKLVNVQQLERQQQMRSSRKCWSKAIQLSSRKAYVLLFISFLWNICVNMLRLMQENKVVFFL
jgi:hypothetical protein